MNQNHFILNIKRFRKENKLKQQDLADLSGIARTTLSGYETGTNEPTLYSLIKLSNAMNCTLDELVGSSYSIKDTSYKIDYDSEVINISQDDFKKALFDLNTLIAKNQSTFYELEMSKKRSDRMLDELTMSKKRTNKMLDELILSKNRSDRMLDELTMSKKRNDLIFEEIKRTINRTSKTEEIFVDLSEKLLSILDKHSENNEDVITTSDFISATLEKSTSEDKLKELSKQKRSFNSETGMIYANVYGGVACGIPTPPYTDLDEHIKIPLIAPLSESKDYFVLQASGDSMNKLISDGEQIIVERTQIIEDGDIAVFLINGECTLKEYESDGDSSCTLKPLSTNPIHEAQYYESTVDLHVQGKYVCKVKDLLKEYDEIMKAKESL